MKNLSDCECPCPCGWRGDVHNRCTCAEATITKYQKRTSGPLLDRIVIHIEVPRVDYEKLSGDRLGKSSESIRKRVQTARDIQHGRFSKLESKHAVFCNTDVRIGKIWQFCELQDEGAVLSLSKHQGLMRAAMSQMNLSARAYHRILKLSRTSQTGRE